MARCQNCNKFTALEMQEPEAEDPEISEGVVTCNVRIVRTSECCGDEMKEATLEMEADINEHLEDHLKKKGDHELEIEQDGVDTIEEGGGRYAKSYFGAVLNFSIWCSCQNDKDGKRKKNAKPVYSGSIDDKVAASHMDEMY